MYVNQYTKICRIILINLLNQKCAEYKNFNILCYSLCSMAYTHIMYFILQFDLMLSEDGSGRGAALVAAVAERAR